MPIARFFLLLASVAACLLVSACAPPAASSSEVEAERALLEAELARLLPALGAPGATLAIARGDANPIAVSAGVADLETGEAMPPDARMFGGSTGKTFVAALVLQLVAEGKVALDDRVAPHFETEGWYASLPNSDVLTVRMLLSHTSGLPRYVLDERLWRTLNEEPDRTFEPKELLQFVSGVAAVHPPGEGWAYSDTNYLVLGLLVEKLTGQSYYAELERRVLAPLALTDTEPSTKRRYARLPQGYTSEGNKPPFFLAGTTVLDGEYIFNPSFEWTGGGLVTSASDMTRWASALYGGKVVETPLFEAMFEATPIGASDGAGYGLGVFVWPSPWGDVVGHGGIFPGYQTQVLYLRDHELALTLQVNADRTSGKLEQNLKQLLDALIPKLIETEESRG